mgnify:CR=1 FL=1
MAVDRMLDSQIVKIDFVKVTLCMYVLLALHVDVNWFESEHELIIQYSCRVATLVGILPRLSQCLKN